MKVALVTNMLSPYRVPLLNAVNRESPDQWTTYFLYGSLSDRRWPDRRGELEMPHRILVPARRSGWPQRGLAAIHLARALVLDRPDVLVIGGYYDPASWIALAWAKATGRPVVLWMATWAGSRFRGDALSVLLSARFVSACDACVAYSTRAARYVDSLGGPAGATWVGPNIGDTGFFRREVPSRRERNQPDGIVRLLYVGTLSHRKGLDRLFAALERLAGQAWRLRLVGSGPEREALGARARDRGWEDRVEFVDEVPPTQLVDHYAASDVLILPSRNEPGAIVLSEALASGLWVIVSDVDGVAPDLVQRGVNGELVDASDPKAFAGALSCAIRDVSSGRIRAHDVLRSSEDLTPERYARAFLSALDSVRSGSGAR